MRDKIHIKLKDDNMTKNTFSCWECGREISRSVRGCPHCGREFSAKEQHKIKDPNSGKLLVLALIGFSLIAAFIFM